jgi:Predicted phosphatase/phosphohexomutase
MTQKIKIESIDAVIFDMDDVITETSAAWKQLFDEYLRDKEGSFEIDPDYYTYINGKTCYEGIESFLRSRNISIPYGHPEDSPEQETICGLGNKKNGHFLKQLKEERIEPFSSIELVRKLKQRGICTAVVSESQNCRAVLEAAGVKELFDGIVDGTDAAELGLKNKQSMLTEAIRRLGIRPERSAVIEYSPAGVEAGKRADFELVIGVDRADQGEKLRDHGAHLVVKDLSEIEISRKKKPVSALEDIKAIFRHLRQGIPAVFLDYDGTLTPIVDSPEKAIMSEEVREVLEVISKHWRVAVISGRDLNDVKKWSE